MESWQYEEDRMLANPPEAPESKCKCERCQEPLLPDDKYFDCEGYIFCEECAREWLEEQAQFVSEEMAYGI